ncbi:MAG TPA: SWIM zinc finger family protein, partial [Gemmatimonadales bacterium]|nr:SWIM zinc finger family protein [Gemmatimonadales bacterium]
MPLTLAQVEGLAPDQASLDAASKLLRPAKWATAGRDAEGRLVWGECQGSGSAPYRTVGSPDDLGYRCSCPSRKFPCKHSLALLWRFVEQPEQFAVGAPPEWVTDWLAKRRPRQSSERAAPGVPTAPKERSIAAARGPAGEPAEEPADDAKAARGAQQRERTAAAREAAVLDALDELEQWIGDQVDRGLAHFQAVAREQCRAVARRLADGKAAALANRLDGLPADLFNAPERDRGELLIQRLGALHLLVQAYRRQDALPAGLRHDVRRLIGWTVKRDELLADPEATRVRATWTTLAVTTELEPDGLRRVETWLARNGREEPRCALLLDYFPA